MVGSKAAAIGFRHRAGAAGCEVVSEMLEKAALAAGDGLLRHLVAEVEVPEIARQRQSGFRRDRRRHLNEQGCPPLRGTRNPMRAAGALRAGLAGMLNRFDLQHRELERKARCKRPCHLDPYLLGMRRHVPGNSPRDPAATPRGTVARSMPHKWPVDGNRPTVRAERCRVCNSELLRAGRAATRRLQRMSSSPAHSLECNRAEVAPRN